MHDSQLLEGRREEVQLLQLQDMQHQLGLRGLQEWLSQRPHDLEPHDEPPTRMGLLLLHEEQTVQDKKQNQSFRQ